MIPKYSWDSARRDLLAGATVAAIDVPQAMAYALIAGVDPRYGLYSAVVVALVASIFGSSSHLIDGPTNAISLVVFSALAFVNQSGHSSVYEAMFLLGIMIGIAQILIAVFKLGDLTRYISESVVIGFMAGAGFLVALGQVGNLFGMTAAGTGDQHILLRFWNTIAQGSPNWYAVGIGCGTILLVLGLRQLANRLKLPRIDMLAALLIASFVAAYFGWSIPGANGKTVLAVIGAVPRALPAPHIPKIEFWWVKEMSGSAVAIALLGLLESLAVAKSIAHMTRQKLDFNRQCLAEGMANLTGGFFQCLPGSGSLTRSAINYQAGAVSRMAGIFASLTVALTVVSLAPFARFIPKAALAGLLMVTASRLVDWGRLRYAVRSSRFDGILVIVTAFAAIFISVEFSILIGVGMSIVLFVPRAARLRGGELVMTPDRVVRERHEDDPHCTAMIIYDLEGEVFFGAAPELDRHFDAVRDRVERERLKIVILRVKRTRNPDLVFVERVEHFIREMQEMQVTVLICGVRADFAQAMRNVHFDDWMPQGSVFREGGRNYSSTLKAVRHAYELLGDRNDCLHCAEVPHDSPEELSFLS